MTLDQIQTWTDINIKSIKAKYNLQNFVETGVYLGDSVQIAYNSAFTSVYSCDINPTYVNAARKKYPHATIVGTDSVTFLRTMLPLLQGTTLFWLDAHFPGFFNLSPQDSNGDKSLEMPLFDELKLIKEYKVGYEYDVIMCDDMRTLRHPNNPKYVPNELDEALYIDCDWDAFVNQFSDTHDYRILMPDSGAIIWTPKA